MKKNYWIILALLVVIVLVYVEPAYAGPGGAIAKGFFKTWWGKIILLLLALIFLPLIIYIRMREWFAVRKNKKELTKLGIVNRDFSWLELEKQIKNVFTRVYNAWNQEDMSKVSEYVSSWYWQNQQLVHLDRWKENNQKNVCDLRRVISVKPLYLEISGESDLEGSRIAFLITGEIQDFLIDRTSGKVVQGGEGYSDEEHIWIMEYSKGSWILDDIQDGELSLAFAKLPNVIPEHIHAASN